MHQHQAITSTSSHIRQLIHINQLLFTELLVLERSHITLPKSQLLCTTYILFYKKLNVIACQLPIDNTAYFDILKWLIWTFSTLSFWKLLRFLWVINLPQLYALYLAGFCSLVSSSKGSTMVQDDACKKNAMENLSLSEFTTTLCSTLSYSSLVQTCIIFLLWVELVYNKSPQIHTNSNIGTVLI